MSPPDQLRVGVQTFEILLLSKLERRASYAFRLLREYAVRVRPEDRQPAAGAPPVDVGPPVELKSADWQDWKGTTCNDAPRVVEACMVFQSTDSCRFGESCRYSHAGGGAGISGDSARGGIPIVNLAGEHVGEAVAGESAAQILSRVVLATGADRGLAQLVLASTGKVLDSGSKVPALPSGDVLRLYEWLQPPQR